MTDMLMLAQADAPSGAPAGASDKKLGDVAPGDSAGKEGDAKKGAAKKAGEADATKKTADSAKTEAKQEEPGNAWYDAGALGLLREGGFFMWPILVLGIVAAGVIIERYRSLKMLKTDAPGLRDKVLHNLHEDDPEAALEACEREQGPVPAILASGLRRYTVLRRLGYDPARIETQVVKTMEDYGVHVVAALERHLPVLATVSSVAPMVGFLGTVQGMVVAFNEIKEGIGTANIIELAAGGIGIALLTTCFGLIVGIPAFIAFNYFTSVINRFVLDVEESAAELMEAVTLKMTLESDGDNVAHLPGELDEPDAPGPPGMASTERAQPLASDPQVPTEAASSSADPV